MSLFKIKTKIRRVLTRFLKIHRPPSFPFITGDGFRMLAQHILDESTNITPYLVEENDIVFVRNDFLKEFFENIHPKIHHPYILLSTNDDANISQRYQKYLDDKKIIHWFAKNVTFTHIKLTPIPIGLTNYYYNFIGRGKVSYILEAQKELDKREKKNKMSFGFFIHSHIERKKLSQELSKNKLAEALNEKEQSVYFKKMSHYTFTISPEGNGTDCHRTWEALYLKTIPIVKKSLVTEYFKDIGLPLLLINDWDELNHFDETFLYQKYEELKSGFYHPSLYMDYWISLIISKRINS